MSFKPRIFYYDELAETVDSPEEIDSTQHLLSPYGTVWGLSWESLEDQPDTIPLISTAKKAKNGNEIVDGHIIHQQFYDMNNKPTHQGKGVVIWDDSTEDGLNCLGFRVIPIDYDNERHFISNSDNVRVVGHALTDPEMTPDSFDVEQYFD